MPGDKIDTRRVFEPIGKLSAFRLQIPFAGLSIPHQSSHQPYILAFRIQVALNRFAEQMGYMVGTHRDAGMQPFETKVPAVKKSSVSFQLSGHVVHDSGRRSSLRRGFAFSENEKRAFVLMAQSNQIGT